MVLALYCSISHIRSVQKKYFAHREFSFTFQNDIYSRFNSFVDCEAFKKHVLSGVPVKMDFGAVYNVAVSALVPCEMLTKKWVVLCAWC